MGKNFIAITSLGRRSKIISVLLLSMLFFLPSTPAFASSVEAPDLTLVLAEDQPLPRASQPLFDGSVIAPGITHQRSVSISNTFDEPVDFILSVNVTPSNPYSVFNNIWFNGITVNELFGRSGVIEEVVIPANSIQVFPIVVHADRNIEAAFDFTVAFDLLFDFTGNFEELYEALEEEEVGGFFAAVQEFFAAVAEGLVEIVVTAWNFVVEAFTENPVEAIIVSISILLLLGFLFFLAGIIRPKRCEAEVEGDSCNAIVRGKQALKKYSVEDEEGDTTFFRLCSKHDDYI